MKLFAAIKPPEHTVRQLTRFQKGVSVARWSDPEKLHVTLGYFGEVDDGRAEILDTELARMKMGSFDMHLSGAGHFGNMEPRAIWLGVDMSDELARLHMHCRRAARIANIQMETRNFRPHITLAYLRPGAPLERIIAFEQGLARFKAGPILVDEFMLFSSLNVERGTNLYRMEASYPLLPF